jgi:AbrB family looped-hinge helix DNA binding protein
MGKGQEFIATVTSKGQVTIPAAVREKLGITAQDKIIFRLGKDRRVEIEPLPMSLEEAFGSVAPLNRPEHFDEIERVAREEKEQQWLDQLSK